MDGGDQRLTIVVTGRNDGYGGGNFTARFFRTLRFNHDRLRDAGVSHEVVLVEWAPPPDRPHLIDLLAEALPDVSTVVRTVLVDPKYHEACTLHPQTSVVPSLEGAMRAAMWSSVALFMVFYVLVLIVRMQLAGGRGVRIDEGAQPAALDVTKLLDRIVGHRRNSASVEARPLLSPRTF